MKSKLVILAAILYNDDIGLRHWIGGITLEISVNCPGIVRPG